MLNAANEISVAAFLAGRIGFQSIAATNEAVLHAHLERREGAVVSHIDDVRAADQWARERARRELGLAPGAPA